MPSPRSPASSSCQAYRRQYGCDFISRHADQSLRPGRQFRPARRPCRAGADRQGARRQACARKSLVVWGTGRPRASSCMSTTPPTAGLPDEELLRREIVNLGTRQRGDHRRAGREGLPRRRLRGTVRLRRQQAGRHAAQGHRCLAPRGDGLARARSALEEGLERAYAWYRAHPTLALEAMLERA